MFVTFSLALACPPALLPIANCLVPLPSTPLPPVSLPPPCTQDSLWPGLPFPCCYYYFFPCCARLSPLLACAFSIARCSCPVSCILPAPQIPPKPLDRSAASCIPVGLSDVLEPPNSGFLPVSRVRLAPVSLSRCLESVNLRRAKETSCCSAAQLGQRASPPLH